MKSKLVKYPYNDGKRFMWETRKMGKTFEYAWNKSLPNNYDYISPYIKTDDFTYVNAQRENYGYCGLDGSTETVRTNYFNYNGIDKSLTTDRPGSQYANAVAYQSTADNWDTTRYADANATLKQPTDTWYGTGAQVIDGYNVDVTTNITHWAHIVTEEWINDEDMNMPSPRPDMYNIDTSNEIISGNRPEFDILYPRRAYHSDNGYPSGAAFELLAQQPLRKMGGMFKNNDTWVTYAWNTYSAADVAQIADYTTQYPNVGNRYTNYYMKSWYGYWRYPIYHGYNNGQYEKQITYIGYSTDHYRSSDDASNGTYYLKHYYVVGTSAQNVRDLLSAKIAAINTENENKVRDAVERYSYIYRYPMHPDANFFDRKLVRVITSTSGAVLPSYLILTAKIIEEAGNIAANGVSDNAQWINLTTNWLKENLVYLYNDTSISNYAINAFPTAQTPLSSIFTDANVYNGMQTIGHFNGNYWVGIVVDGKIVANFPTKEVSGTPTYYYITNDGVSNTFPGNFTVNVKKAPYQYGTTPSMPYWTHYTPTFTNYYAKSLNTRQYYNKTYDNTYRNIYNNIVYNKTIGSNTYTGRHYYYITDDFWIYSQLKTNNISYSYDIVNALEASRGVVQPSYTFTRSGYLTGKLTRSYYSYGSPSAYTIPTKTTYTTGQIVEISGPQVNPLTGYFYAMEGDGDIKYKIYVHTYRYTITTQPTLPQIKYIVNKNDWDGIEDIFELPTTNLTDWRATGQKLIYPVIKLIGDVNTNTLTVPSGNTTIKSYTIGEPEGEELNPKSLLINAPTSYIYSRHATQYNPKTDEYYKNEYVDNYIVLPSGHILINTEFRPHLWIKPLPTEVTQDVIDEMLDYDISSDPSNFLMISNGTYYIMTYNEELISSSIYNGILSYCDSAYLPVYDVKRTWLTFNTYTQDEWVNGYHFLGNQWNNIGSPWAYAGHITEADAEHKFTVVSYENCEAGNYELIFAVVNQANTVVEDSNGNTFSKSPDKYYDLVGNLYYFGEDYVYSQRRNAYPDNGYRGNFLYRLAPEKTKFIQYYIDTEGQVTQMLMSKNRYAMTHEDVFTDLDTSLYGTTIGTASSTNESSIPDAKWTHYMGTYMGQSIPFLNIVEETIPESEILGIPIYDKQINTSETLKYGTVAAASLTFTMNKPVDEAITHQDDLLVIWYDFENNNTWRPYGFFYIDNIEAIDEYTTRITAHDEAYKLNKYVDNFLEEYTGAATVSSFYTDLLDYCGCDYDLRDIGTFAFDTSLQNVYHAIKTTGTEVAHYIAAASAAFIHANIEGDIKIQQYVETQKYVDIDDYADLKYTAYNSDTVNNVKITAKNAVIGEDVLSEGDNTYYVSDNPIISTLNTSSFLNEWATAICQKYLDIPAYRPAELQFLISPNLNMGEIFFIRTPRADFYRAIVMAMTIDSTGIVIRSLGSQTFPVESQSNSQFVNLINDIDSVSGDVANLETAGQILGQRMEAAEGDIDSLEGRMATAETNISNNATAIQNKINNDSISMSNNLATIKINGTSYSNIPNTTAVSSLIGGAIATSEGKNSVSSSNNLASVKINNNTVPDFVLKGYLDANNSISETNDLVSINLNGTTQNEIATKDYVDNNAGISEYGARFRQCRLTFNNNTYAGYYIGKNAINSGSWTGIILPPFYFNYTSYGGYVLFGIDTGTVYGLKQSNNQWERILGATVQVGW